MPQVSEQVEACTGPLPACLSLLFCNPIRISRYDRLEVAL